MRGLMIMAAWLAGAAAAQADCDHFKWSLAREKAWFAQAPQPLASGADLTGEDRAFALALKPAEAAGFVLAPKKAPTPGEFGGVARLALAKPGLYQVTLSREAWVDVIQNGARARTRNVSRQRDCPSFVKSVRFELAAGPAALEISAVGSPALALSFAEAP